jgi:hypothetical protein
MSVLVAGLVSNAVYPLICLTLVTFGGAGDDFTGFP